MSETRTRCPQVAVLRDPVDKVDRIYTCGQRPGHEGLCNEKAPCDWRTMREEGCTHTSWSDHPAPGYVCPDKAGAA